MKEQIKKLTRYHQIKALYEKYERILMPATLVSGTALDFVTFKTIQIKTSLLLFVIYFIVAGFAIAFLHLYDAKPLLQKVGGLRYLRLICPLIIQLTFGALLSASFIFYWFSGALSASWPFILIIAILMVSNDVFRYYFLRTTVMVGVFYFITFSLSAMILPYVFNSISLWTFILAGICSLVVIVSFIYVLQKLLPSIKERKAGFVITVSFIFIFMNALYFLNIIPPIPLALREAGVYHDIQRSLSGYRLQTETVTWYEKLLPVQTIHIRPGDRVYVYSAIFAPAKLNTTMIHHWQYYDPEVKAWVEKDRIPFSLIGGRQEGFRGYSYKTFVPAGMWRVNVETSRGQIVGRIKFKVESAQDLPELQIVER